MNYDWLFSFVVFSDHLNFTHAAAELHITQPALHAQIRKLGDEIGTALYRRKGRGIVLTAEGRRLAAYGRQVQAQGRDMLAELRGESSRGPVVLASGQGALLYLLGPALRRFPKERWPLRVLPMTGPEALNAIRDARADVGVAVVAGAVSDLECRELQRIGQLVIVAQGHRLAKRRKVGPADLDGEGIIAAPEGSPHRTMLSQAIETAGARLSVAVEAMGWELMLQLAKCGLGIAVVNDFCPVPRGFVGIPLEGVPNVAYGIVTRRGKPTEAQAALIRTIVDSVP